MWTSPAGHHQRIDYVAVPAYLASAVQASWGFEVPLPREHDDHRATVVQWAFSRSMPRARVQRNHRYYIPNREASALQADFTGMPPVAWREGLDVHAGCLVRQYQSVLKRRSHPTASGPREPYVDEQALELIQGRRSSSLSCAELVRRFEHNFCSATNLVPGISADASGPIK